MALGEQVVLPPQVWEKAQTEHARQKKEEHKVHPGEIPVYALCSFCGGMTPIDWVPDVHQQDFVINLVDGCPVCTSFREQGQEYDDFMQMLHRVMYTHELWMHYEKPDASNHRG